MPLYEITDNGVEKQDPTTFADAQLRERDDIQRLLRTDIGAIDSDLLVVAEEFGEWEEARRRVDLLALDREGRLVVIELKRTEGGGHMDLQALRYAAMVSSMVVGDVVRAYEGFLAKTQPGKDLDARELIAQHLAAEDDEELALSNDVRILLVSADFGREITTAVLWLNGFEGIDIRCVRLVPYSLDGRLLLDIQQVVPLPEAADYQVRLRRKDQERERSRTDGRDFTKYRIVIDGVSSEAHNKRRAIKAMVAALIDNGADANRIAEILGPRKFRGAEGRLTDPASMVGPMEAFAPELRFAPDGWFLEDPFFSDGQTWVVSKTWGTDTETALTELSAAFPEAKVRFESALPGD